MCCPTNPKPQSALRYLISLLVIVVEVSKKMVSLRTQILYAFLRHQKPSLLSMPLILRHFHVVSVIKPFSSYYSRTFLRFAAERFGEDHPDITKCLSGDDLKRIALFGGPSVGKKTAFAAKRLHSYFSIQEDMVCRPCKLKTSCKVMDHTVGQKVHQLNLANVMQVLTLYALDLVPPQPIVPEEIKGSISKLLCEVVDLSQYCHELFVEEDTDHAVSGS